MVPAPPRIPLPSGNDPERLEETKRLGWNWAGFLLPYLWLLGHGRASAGLGLLASTCIPFFSLFHVLLYPGTAIYLGLNGYELAWRSQPYHSVEQMRDRQREWVIWGIVLNVLFFLFLVFMLVYMRTMFQTMMDQMGDLGI
jgi:hypothetical protein